MKTYIKPSIFVEEIIEETLMLSASQEKKKKVFFDNEPDPEWGFHGFEEEVVEDENEIL